MINSSNVTSGWGLIISIPNVNAAMLFSGEDLCNNSNFVALGFTLNGDITTCNIPVYTRGEHANHYTTEAVSMLFIRKIFDYKGIFQSF